MEPQIYIYKGTQLRDTGKGRDQHTVMTMEKAEGRGFRAVEGVAIRIRRDV